MPRRGTFPRRARALLLAAALASAAAQAVPAATVLTVDGARLEVELDSGAFRAGGAVLTAWITRSARIVAGYYGRFPAARLTIRVRPQGGAGVQGGSTFGVPRPLIRVRVGREVTEAQLLHDWVLVHEMIHLALPDVGAEHAWLSEGLATYVEGVARVQAGNRPEEDVWAEEIREMPYGLPQAGDAGLDRTHSWGRTYWGGALFCLLADVEIRERTHNRYGLQDALRGILAAGGNISTEADIAHTLKTADQAVGVPVLTELYASMQDRPVTPDLPALWKKLGVIERDGKVSFDDSAPDAAIRKALTAPGTR